MELVGPTGVPPPPRQPTRRGSRRRRAWPPTRTGRLTKPTNPLT